MSRPAAPGGRFSAWAPRIAALMAGAAAALAQPPFGILPGLLGYAAILALCDRASAPRPLRSAFLRGFLAGLGYFGASLGWIADPFFVDAAHDAWMAPFAVAGVAVATSLYWGLAGALYRFLAPASAWRLLVFAGALAACEWLRGHLFTGFPWDLPGETWRAGSAPSQTASLVGAYGLSWITVAIAAAPGLGWRTRGAKLAMGLAAVALAALYGFGLARLAAAPPAAPAGAPIVRIVQPDTPERASYDSDAFAVVLQRNLALTASPAAQPPQIVIWSEQGLPDALGDYLAPGTWTLARIEAALRPGETLITGGYRAVAAGKGEAADDGLVYRNSLVALQRTATGVRMTALYDKHRLVPFGEYLPFDAVLGPLGVRQLIHVGPGFTAGPPTRTIAPDGAPPVLPLICYEALFPEIARSAAAEGRPAPRWIVNISDDAWFGPGMGPLQHLNLASYRAIEEGLPMARATPTGVSAMIDAYGRIAGGKRLAHGAFGVIDSPLPPTADPTVFQRLGEAPFALMLLVSLMASRALPCATLRRNTGAV